MPHYPEFSHRPGLLTGSIFEQFMPKMREKGDDLVRLHLGDSWQGPPYPLPLNEAFTRTHRDFNRYCNTYGIHSLRAELAAKLSSENQLPVTADQVMITSGGTNALSAVTQSLLEPGEDVLLLSPYWPFIRGMIALSGARAIEIPFYTRLYEEPDMDIGACLDRCCTANTTLLYLNNPNNPSGKVLTAAQLQQVADFAQARNLWVISDEAYDGMSYALPHLSIAALPGMFERTFSVFTFSKQYMFAGIRLGYVAGETEAIRAVNKVMVHQIYSATTVGQRMVLPAVEQRADWSARFVGHCRGVRDSMAQQLEVDHYLPDGAYYFFFSIKNYLHGRSYRQVIEELLDAGVSIALGQDFGRDYSDYIRVCYAAESAERVELATRRLNKVLSGR